LQLAVLINNTHSQDHISFLSNYRNLFNESANIKKNVKNMRKSNKTIAIKLFFLESFSRDLSDIFFICLSHYVTNLIEENVYHNLSN